MSCSPFNDFISSPHFNEPFEFITPDRIGDHAQDFCPTFNPFQVEQSIIDTSITEVIDPNPQPVEPLDADALLERLDHAEHESGSQNPENAVLMEEDPFEVLEASSINDSVVELVQEEDSGQLLEEERSQCEASDLVDLEKKQKNTPSFNLERLRRPSFKVVPAKVKYETLGEMVHVPMATPERRADFSEPIEPVVEPEATFVWKGERGGGLKLDKVKNYEEFGLPLTDMKLHKKWRSNRARKLYFKEPTLDLCRMRNSDQGSSLEELEEESKFFLPGFKVPIIHHTEFEEPVLLHLESGEPILVQKVGGRRKARIDFDEQYQRLCNLLPLNQDPNKMSVEVILEAACIFVRHLAQQEIQLARLKVREMEKHRALRNRFSIFAQSFG